MPWRAVARRSSLCTPQRRTGVLAPHQGTPHSATPTASWCCLHTARQAPQSREGVVSTSWTWRCRRDSLPSLAVEALQEVQWDTWTHCALLPAGPRTQAARSDAPTPRTPMWLARGLPRRHRLWILGYRHCHLWCRRRRVALRWTSAAPSATAGLPRPIRTRCVCTGARASATLAPRWQASPWRTSSATPRLPMTVALEQRSRVTRCTRPCRMRRVTGTSTSATRRRRRDSRHFAQVTARRCSPTRQRAWRSARVRSSASGGTTGLSSSHSQSPPRRGDLPRTTGRRRPGRRRRANLWMPTW